MTNIKAKQQGSIFLRNIFPFDLLLLCYAAALLFSLSSCSSVSVEHQKEAEFHYKMGMAYLNEGNIQMASVQMQNAHRLDPDNKEIINALGIIHLQLSEFKKAEDLFLKVLAMDSEFSDAYHNLGVVYINTGQWNKAIEHFKKALQNPLYKTAEKSYHLLGVSYYRIGRTDLAIAAFKDSIKRSPSFALPYYGLALAYNKVGRYADAASVISIAIETDAAYKGDKKRFIEDIKQRLLTAKGEEEADLMDYIEILRY